jgi:hypothetical protein
LKGAETGSGLAPQFANWVLGCILIYASLFGIGYLVLASVLKGLAFIAAAVITGVLIMRNLERTGWHSSASIES